MIPIYIVGFGGFAREVYSHCKELEDNKELCIKGFITTNIDKKEYNGIPIYDEADFDYAGKNVVIGVGNPILREKIWQKIFYTFGRNVYFPNIISPRAILLNKKSINMGIGNVICAGTILTCDIKIKNFVQLNLNTTIGHDCYLGNFMTTAPGVNISGCVKAEKGTYFGTNSSVLENIHIVDDVIIGAGAVVVRDIMEKGTYVGIPAKRIK